MKLSAAIVLLASTLCLSSAESQDRVFSRVLKKDKAEKKGKAGKGNKAGKSSKTMPTAVPTAVPTTAPEPTPEPTPAPDPREVMFSELDTSGDGVLDFSEFREGYNFYKPEAVDVMALEDLGQETELDLEAFLGTSLVRTQTTFAFLDADGDGVVSVADLVSRGAPEAEIQQLFNFAKIEDGETLSFREILWFYESPGSIEKYVAEVDPQLGVITLDSFAAANGLTDPVEIGMLWQEFSSAFDITMDGIVDGLEWIAGYGYYLDEEVLAVAEAFIGRVDTDEDGFASPDELVNTFGSSPQIIGFLLASFDANQDGLFEASEFATYYRLFYGYP